MLFLTKSNIIAFLSIIFFIGCEKNVNYSIHNYYSQVEADTIITNIITYISKKPKTADWQTRHESRFRDYYKKQLPNFDLRYFHMAEDSTHYFYIIRPARSPLGNLRGVGGKFTLNESLKITEFEEIFNTPVMTFEQLDTLGEKLFSEMFHKGNIDQYIDNKNLVEWPDDRLKYDKTINEWVYQDNFKKDVLD